MTTSAYLTKTLTRLRQAWAGAPPEFMGHPLTDPQSIAHALVEQDAGEDKIRDFLRQTIGNRKINNIHMTLALRTLMENGSKIAAKFRNSGISTTMGDYHDQGEDYPLAALQYTIAYLHGQDSGFYHMASEIETFSHSRDAQGYMNAIHYLTHMDDNPHEAIENIPENLIKGAYPPEYYDELAKAMKDHPQIKQAISADFLIYRAAAAARHGQDRSRAWRMHIDGLRAGPTEHALKNPFVRDAFTDRHPQDHEFMA